MIYKNLSFDEKYSLLYEFIEINEKKTKAGIKRFPKRKEQIEKQHLIIYSFLVDLIEDVEHEHYEFLLTQNRSTSNVKNQN